MEIGEKSHDYPTSNSCSTFRHRAPRILIPLHLRNGLRRTDGDGNHKRPGSEMRVGMAIGAIGGLITSTFLTLLFVPVIYELLEDFFALFGIVVFRVKETPAPEVKI